MRLDAGRGSGVHGRIERGLVTSGNKVEELTRQKNTDVMVAKQSRFTQSEM